MIILLVAIGAALLVVPGLVLAPLRRLEPAQSAKATAACLLIGAATLEVALLLWAAPTVLQAVDDAAFASACSTVIDRLAPGGPVVGWVAAFLAGLVATRALRATIRARRQADAARVEPGLGRHVDRGAFDLVIVPTERLVAVSVPGARPQVVLSEGLMRTLTPREVEAVIRHEAAHHGLAHHRYLMLASVLEQTLRRVPLVRRSTATLRNALERWADDAATDTAWRRSSDLRDAIVGVACAKVAYEASAVGLKSSVLDRVDRLVSATRVHRELSWVFVYTPIAMVAIVTLALVVGWLTTTHHAVALVDYCPS